MGIVYIVSVPVYSKSGDSFDRPILRINAGCQMYYFRYYVPNAMWR